MKEFKASVIEARTICLIDEDGNNRIVLDAGKNNGPSSISLFSRSAKRSVVVMSQDDDSVEVTLRGENGVSSLSLRLGAQNQGSILLTETSGLPIIIIGSNMLNQGGLGGILFFRDGNVVCRVPDDGGGQRGGEKA